jgi:prevent-host-death family protein
MATLTFRSSHGDLIDIPAVAASQLKSEFGAVFERVTRGGAVAITKHDVPKAVLISYDEFQALVQARTPALDELTSQFEGLLARMQTPKARKAMEAAFNATPAVLGRAAVKMANANRGPKRVAKGSTKA